MHTNATIIQEIQEYRASFLVYKPFSPGDTIICVHAPIGQSRPAAGDLAVVVSQFEPKVPECDGCPVAASLLGDTIIVVPEEQREGMAIRHAHSGHYALATPEQIEAYTLLHS